MDVRIMAVQVAEARLKPERLLLQNEEAVGPQLAKSTGHSQLERHIEPGDIQVSGKRNAAQVVDGRTAAGNETKDPLESVPAVAGHFENTARPTTESSETG